MKPCIVRLNTRRADGTWSHGLYVYSGPYATARRDERGVIVLSGP